MFTLSREEKNNLSIHLNIALSILFLLGIVIGIVGYLNIKASLVIIGSLISLGPVIYLMIVTFKEEKKAREDLLTLPLQEIKDLKVSLDKAEFFIKSYSIKGELNYSTTSKINATNHLSLVRLINKIKERLETVEDMLSSKSISTIEKGTELLNSSISFPPTDNQNLEGHTMPDVPKTSWIDSLNFLIKELEKKSQ